MTSLERAIQKSKEREENRPENPLAYANGKLKWEPKWRKMVENAKLDFSRIKELCEQVMPNPSHMYLAIINSINSIHKTVGTAEAELERLAKEGLDG